MAAIRLSVCFKAELNNQLTPVALPRCVAARYGRARSVPPRRPVTPLAGVVAACPAARLAALQARAATIVQQSRHVAAVTSSVSGSGGRMFVTLKPRGQRGKIDQVVDDLRKDLRKVNGLSAAINPVQNLRLGGRSSKSRYQYVLQSVDSSSLYDWGEKMERAMRKDSLFQDVNSDAQRKGLQAELHIDRDKAAQLGVGMQAIRTALYTAFGQRQVATLYDRLNQYKVVMEAAPRFWQGPQGLEQVHVMTADGRAVPLSAFATWGPGNTALSVSHQGSFVASTVSFNLAPGVSLAAAQQAIRDAMARIGVPTGVQGSFQGTAKAFQEASSNQPLLILAALVAVYLVLGILYESLVHPITILSTLPSAGVGALLALLLTGNDLGLIAIIGIILLIGIVKKNAIMMIDFALEAERHQGMAPQEAIYQAALLRFRPILMTTLAALFGAIPLMLASGSGAELRQPLGLVMVGGLLLSQVLTLFTTPVIYLAFDRLSRRLLGRSASGVPA